LEGDALITVENLTRKFGNVTAVEDLSFDIAEGEVFSFLGPNGAGKTTTMRILCCLIAKTSGKASINGYDVSKPADALKIRGMIGFVPDDVGLYNELSVTENLVFYARLYDFPAAQIQKNIEHYLKLLELWEQRNAPAGTLSKGMKQKLSLARALVHEPQVLFMDEPTANLDPEASKTVRDFILSLKNEKRTIFINTHNLDEAQRLSDSIGIIKTKLLTIGTPEQLKESLSGIKTELVLAQASDAVVKALQKLAPGKVEVQGQKILVQIKDANADNPSIVAAAVAAGGQIVSVNPSVSTLEDVYLKVVGELK
jgi:ABC-2 type transport system ATP-binding protein